MAGANTNEPLHFEANIDTNLFLQRLDEMERNVNAFATSSVEDFNKVDNVINTLAKGAGAYFTLNYLKELGNSVIKVRGEFQQTEIAFSTMLRSEEKAKGLMKDMIDLAAKTPLSMQKVTQGAKQLLAFQVPLEEITDTLRRMGDIASGLGVSLDRIQLVYGQVKAKGRLMGDDLRQFTEAGIPMVAELAKMLNRTTAEISDMVSAGKIGFKDVQKVLFNMTSEGGMFFNMMDKQSESVLGRIEKLKDAIDIMFNNIGQNNEGIIYAGIDGIATLIENYEKVADILGFLVTVYGAYKTAVILTSIISHTRDVIANARAWIAVATGTQTATTAQLAYNAAARMNPYGLLLAGAAGLIYLLFNLEMETSKNVSAQENLKRVLKESGEAKEEFKRKSQTLKSIIDDETQSIKAQMDAYRELQELNPNVYKDLSFADYKASNKGDLSKREKNEEDLFTVRQLSAEYAKLAKQIEQETKNYIAYSNAVKENKVDGRFLNEDRERILALKDRAKEIKKQIDLEKENLSIAELMAKPEKERVKIINDRIAVLEKEKSVLEDSYNNLNNQLGGIGKIINLEGKRLAQINKTNDEIAKMTSLLVSDTNVREKDKAYWEGVKKEATEAIEGIDTDVLKSIKAGKADKEITKTYKDAYAKIKEAQSNLSLFDVEKTKKEKVYLQTSIKGMEQSLKKLNEQIESSSPKTDLSAVIKKRNELEVKLSEARERVEYKTLKDGLDKRLNLWEIYYRSVEIYGKESTAENPIFKDLKNYKSVLDNLESLRDKFMSKGAANLSKSEIDYIKEITAEINDIKGIKSPYEILLKDLEVLNSASKTQIDYLNELYKLKDKYANDDSENGLKARKTINTEIDDTKTGINLDINTKIAEFESFEAKKTEIFRKYQQMREQIEAKEFDGKDAVLANLEKSKAKEVSKIAVDDLQNSEVWESLFSNMEQLTASQIDNMILQIEERMPEISKVMSPIDVKTTLSQLEKAKNEMLRKNPFVAMQSSLKAIFKEGENNTAESVASITTKYERLEKSTKEVFGSIKKNITDLEPVKKFMGELGGDAMEQVMTIATTTISLIGLIKSVAVASAESIKAVEKASVILAIIGAALSILQSIGKMISSIFSQKDKKAEKSIKAHQEAVDNLKDAYERLSRAIDKALGKEIYSMQRGRIENLKAQQKELTAMISDERGKKKTDHGRIKEWEKEIKDLSEEIDNVFNEIRDNILQVDFKELSDNLGNALMDAWAKGEDSALAYEKIAKDVIRNIVKNQLIMSLNQPINDALTKLLKQTGLNEFGEGNFNMTDSAINDFMETVKRISEDFEKTAKPIMDNLDKMFGADNLGEGISGAFKGMTEKTAGLLEAQFTAIRIYVADIKQGQILSYQMVENIHAVLLRIETNTNELFEIRRILANNKTIRNVQS